jgi:hypothetical protein
MIQALTYANTNLIADTSVAVKPEIWSKTPHLDTAYGYFVINLSFVGFTSYLSLYFYTASEEIF